MIKKLSPLNIFVYSFLLIIASIRGILVLNLPLSSETVYFMTAISLTLFSLFGIFKSLKRNLIIPTRLSNLMHINLFLGILYVGFSYVIRYFMSMPLEDFTSSIVYMFIAPFSVYLFTRLSIKNLNIAIAIIAMSIVYSVIYDFNILSLGKEGFEKALEYRMLLRPATETLGRAGGAFLPGGYTGDNHDSANILGMVFIFFFARSLIKPKFLDICLTLVFFLALHLTISAANIIVTYLTAIIAIIYICFIKRNFKFLIFLIMMLSFFVILFSLFGEHMNVFLKKIEPGSDRYVIMAQLDFRTICGALPFLLIGHAGDFGHSIIETEISLFKIIFGLGFAPAILLFYILLYPIKLWRKKDYMLNAFPAIAAILFSFLSLFHYGSLFRITSIFLFFSLYSVALKELHDS